MSFLAAACVRDNRASGKLAGIYKIPAQHLHITALYIPGAANLKVFFSAHQGGHGKEKAE